MSRRQSAHPCASRFAPGLFVAAVATVFASPAVVAAPSVGAPIGSAALVNVDTTGPQEYPTLSMDAAGNTTFVWRSGVQPDAALFMRAPGTFQPFPGPTQFRIDNIEPSLPNRAHMDGDAQGRTAVAWIDAEYVPGNYLLDDAKVYLRCQAAPGQPAAQVVVEQMSEDSAGFDARVAMDDDGDIVVTWKQTQHDTHTTQLRMRRYNADCAPKAPAAIVTSGDLYEFLYNTDDVAVNATGGAVIVWAFGTSGSTLFGRRYSAAGAAGPVFEITAPTESSFGGDENPQVAMDAAGAFIVTWSRSGSTLVGDTNVFNSNVFARHYTAAGVAAPEFRVNLSDTGYHAHPDVARDRAGNAVIVWERSLLGDPAIFGRRFPAGMSPSSPEFRVDPSNPPADGRSEPAIAMDADGDFTVAWTERRGTDEDVYSQRFAGFENVDVAASFTDTPTQGEVNAGMDYTVRLQNNHAPSADAGVGLASGVRLRMRTDNDFIGPTGGFMLCDVPFGDDLTCTVPPIPAGSFKDVTFLVIPDTAGQAQVRVDVDTDTVDTAPANNVDVETTPVGPDATPDNLADFEDKAVWGKGVLTTSNRVKLTGFEAPAPISVQEGFEYQVNFGRFTRNAGIVRPGDSVRLRMRSSGAGGQTRTMTVIVGKAAAQWSVTTRIFGRP